MSGGGSPNRFFRETPGVPEFLHFWARWLPFYYCGIFSKDGLPFMGLRAFFGKRFINQEKLSSSGLVSRPRCGLDRKSFAVFNLGCTLFLLLFESSDNLAAWNSSGGLSSRWLA